METGAMFDAVPQEYIANCKVVKAAKYLVTKKSFCDLLHTNWLQYYLAL